MSPRRLLVIGADATCSEVDVSTLLAESEGFRIEQVPWESVEFEGLLECSLAARLPWAHSLESNSSFHCF
jgi:hypothetical protein